MAKRKESNQAITIVALSVLGYGAWKVFRGLKTASTAQDLMVNVSDICCFSMKGKPVPNAISFDVGFDASNPSSSPLNPEFMALDVKINDLSLGQIKRDKSQLTSLSLPPRTNKKVWVPINISLLNLATQILTKIGSIFAAFKAGGALTIGIKGYVRVNGFTTDIDFTKDLKNA